MKIEWFFVEQDIQIQVKGEFDIEIFFDSLDDLIVINGINPDNNTDWLCYDGNVYELTNTDLQLLKERGFCRIYNIGSIDLLCNMNESNSWSIINN